MTMAPIIAILSANMVWREALTIALEDLGAKVVEAPVETISGALIDAMYGTEVTGPSGTSIGLSEQVDFLRARWPELPIILMSSVPIDAYSRYEGADPAIRVVLADTVQTRTLAQNVLQEVAEIAIVMGRAPQPAVDTAQPGQGVQGSPTATIEITISDATLKCDVRIGALSNQWGPSSWNSRPELIDIDNEYSAFEHRDLIRVPDQNFISILGGRLLRSLFREPITFAQDFIKRSGPDGCQINYRFVLQDGDLEFVPFELVATENPGEYLRYVHPLSRKLVAREVHRSADRISLKEKPRQKVLFLLSDVNGTLTVSGETFKGRQTFALGPLRQLKTELRRVKKLYGAENVHVLPLRKKRDNFRVIERVFQEHSFDIVHYAGHSVRADRSGKVFLVLPENSLGSAIPYDVEHFATLAAENDVRLVILSSCEGTSGRALSKMASNGVPAIVGFRWPVEDRDAAIFTPALHEEMWKDGLPVPLSIAFHQALRRLKLEAPERLSWFSPILMIQHSDWHNFAVEV